ncbi:hypothetical protein Afil01_63000 [Actinorhabdospora filicis]|uniref:Glycosyl hydrolase family 71 n=1 Tax=Actinorhabdospora filicis TaxID=1785913 RepID=A0A9W6SSY1_9ACTN|nr:glycoside hydrolase family 71 protein [Actinorhabdospora filicis]GLZ81493.1 hypothetical protein Afil01_63000 [Actinorhabdospora filicis]
MRPIRLIAVAALAVPLLAVPTAAATAQDAPASVAAASPLPFDLPSRDVLEASGKKVFAHYFTQFRISVDNKDGASDYYVNEYLNPKGEDYQKDTDGDGVPDTTVYPHEAYGGYLRDRPLPRGVLPGDWQYADAVTEVTRAVQAGLDGFTVDLLSVNQTSYHWQTLLRLMKAAKQVDPDFKIVIMPDMNAGTIKSLTPVQLADAISPLFKDASTYRLTDGRLVVAPFKAENHDAAWWTSFKTEMANKYAENVALVPFTLNFNATFDKLKSVAYGFSEMEYGTPALQDSLPTKIATAHNAGVKFMASLSPQDSRPSQGNYYEANNSENLRRGWTKAIDGGADWVQLMTWNDYSENHQFSPSVRNGGVWLDLSSYYLTRFKTGAYPAIVRDVTYLVHRNQFAAAKPSSGTQTKFQVVRANGGTPRDSVEVLTFLKAAATVTPTIGGKAAAAYSAPAGVTSKLFPLAYGLNSAVVARSGVTVCTATSPWEVKSQFTVQDMLYSAVSSSR